MSYFYFFLMQFFFWKMFQFVFGLNSFFSLMEVCCQSCYSWRVVCFSHMSKKKAFITFFLSFVFFFQEMLSQNKQQLPIPYLFSVLYCCNAINSQFRFCPFHFHWTELLGPDLHCPRGWPHRASGNSDRKPPDMYHPHCWRLPGNCSSSRRLCHTRS